MYSKILYTSCTGSGQKYAELLSEALGIPAYRLEDAPKADDSKVIYIGWLMAGKVMGYAKAKGKYIVGALVPVGMSTYPGSGAEEVRKNNKVPDYTQIFPVQGGFHMSRLPLPFRLMMKLKNPQIVKALEKKASLNAAQEAMLRMASTGDAEPAEWSIEQIVAACK